MATLYPNQDTFVRGEITPRLHSRASLDLYRAGLSRCLNFLTLPHGGIRRRGGSYFVGEVKTSTTAVRLVPFVFSSEQAYCLEFGNLYVRVYAYGARVGTVEVATPWSDSNIWDLQFYQSADVLWIAHPDFALRTLTRTAHTTWTLAEYLTEDGPFDEVNVSATTLTPSSRGSLNNIAGTASATVGTASNAFDLSNSTDWGSDTSNTGTLTYTLTSGTQIVDAYYIRASAGDNPDASPSTWEFQGYNGSTWVTIDQRSSETGWTRGEVRHFYFQNKIAFSAYRLVVQGTNFADNNELRVAEFGINVAGDTQTPFNLTASSIDGINDGQGFLTSDVGRLIRLRGADGEWRWARIAARTSSTVVTIRLYGTPLPNTSPIAVWRMGALAAVNGGHAAAITAFEERLALSHRFSVYLSTTGNLKKFSPGEEDDDGMEFMNAGGGEANDIVWIADGDGYLLLATTGGIRSLGGSGIDEALTPSSFKNRRSRTHGAARIAPVDAGSAFLYVTRSRRSIAELTMNQYGRFQSEDIGPISEHIPKKGVVELAYQEQPDPVLYFPLDTGELGGFTHQPAQEVRGMHRHAVGGALTGESQPFIESVAVTPGADGQNDDVWLLVRRTIGGVTKRYIELLMAPMESDTLDSAIAVDSALTYEGAATGTVSGLSHLNGQVVDVLASGGTSGSGTVYKGITVTANIVTLPDSNTATKMHVGLPFSSEADTLELDVGGRDGSLIGRRKKLYGVMLSLLETDTTGLEISSLVRGAWEPVRLPTTTPLGAREANLFTGNVKVPIDDSWEGMAKFRIRHTHPTPCTIRSMTPIFDAEP